MARIKAVTTDDNQPVELIHERSTKIGHLLELVRLSFELIEDVSESGQVNPACFELPLLALAEIRICNDDIGRIVQDGLVEARTPEEGEAVQ
jgi:hypothetical protein